MLVHVFETLFEEESTTNFFPEFLFYSCQASELRGFRRDGDYLEIKTTTAKGKKKKLTWSSGTLYQRLHKAAGKYSLPVVWKMGRYFHGGALDKASDTVRGYLSDNFHVQLETVPFILDGRGRLSTRCKIPSEPLPDDLKSKWIKIIVDKQDINVTLLPHRGLAQTLLSSLLKGFL